MVGRAFQLLRVNNHATLDLKILHLSPKVRKQQRIMASVLKPDH